MLSNSSSYNTCWWIVSCSSNTVINDRRSSYSYSNTCCSSRCNWDCSIKIWISCSRIWLSCRKTIHCTLEINWFLINLNTGSRHYIVWSNSHCHNTSDSIINSIYWCISYLSWYTNIYIKFVSSYISNF